MSKTLISVNNLSKQFKDVHAVNGLSFTVQQGDIYGFLGQNGAGKSTSIRMLMGLIQPSGGEINMFGYRMPEHKKEVLRQIGAIIERPDLYKYLSAYDNLDMMARLLAVRQRVRNRVPTHAGTLVSALGTRVCRPPQGCVGSTPPGAAERLVSGWAPPLTGGIFGRGTGSH